MIGEIWSIPAAPNHEAKLRAALAAVAAATVVCRRVQDGAHISALVKADSSPVTIADFASQAVIVRALRAALGPIALVAEEDAVLMREKGADLVEPVLRIVREVWPDASRQSLLEALAGGNGHADPEGFWTLDPVDGTKGFLRRQQYAISLAYVQNGHPTLGVLACPNLPCDVGGDLESRDERGVLCAAIHGHGSFDLSGQRQSRRLHAGVDPLDEPQRICVSAEASHSNAAAVEAVLGRAGVPYCLVPVDSQCKYALVARDQADAYVRIPASPHYAEWIWDHAAGALIASEAGCRVTDLFGRALRFDRGRRLVANWGVLCARPRLHDRLFDAVRESGLSAPHERTDERPAEGL